MVKTTIMKFQGAEGKEVACLMGDLTELYEDVVGMINDAVIRDDRGGGLIAIRDHLAQLIDTSVKQYEDSKQAKLEGQAQGKGAN